MEKFSKLVKKGTDLRVALIERIIGDAQAYAKKGRTQVAHREYLGRLLRQLQTHSIKAIYKEHIIYEICGKLRAEIQRREGLGRLHKGLDVRTFNDLIDDLQSALIGDLTEVMSDYDFIDEDEI